MSSSFIRNWTNIIWSGITGADIAIIVNDCKYLMNFAWSNADLY